MKIEKIIGREIYNSRGWPTIQCEVVLENGQSVYANAPAGLSCGKHEAYKLYDNDKNRLEGHGVLKCIEVIQESIAPHFVGREPHAINMDLELLQMDGTHDKSRFGANVMVAVSMAIYRAHALVEQVDLFEFMGHVCGAETVTLPYPFFNVINGGMHADNALQIQEFMLMPADAADLRNSLEIGSLVFHELRTTLKQYGKSIAFGDEGGYTALFADDIQALDILSETINRVKTYHGYQIFIALDCAISHLYDRTTRRYLWDNNLLIAEEMVAYYESLIQRYPICLIEDGLAEDDWDGWAYMTKRLKNKIQIIGDDLFVTNPERIMRGIEMHAATGVIIKPDQIGTITETLQTIKLCQDNDLMTIISHRSGDTEDTFISDLAVGSSAGQIKAGAICRSERVAKYNRLLMIEDHLAMEL